MTHRGIPLRIGPIAAWHARQIAARRCEVIAITHEKFARHGIGASKEKA